MINLKLAEYNLETGKFERFLEIGKDFGYLGSYILILYSEDEDAEYSGEKSFPLDQKDPLNRFNGRFDGRTYGNGRFVLVESKIISPYDKKIEMSQDDIFSYNGYIQKAVSFNNFHHWQETEDAAEREKEFKILGNLHNYMKNMSKSSQKRAKKIVKKS